MKDKILYLILGILIGAVITAGCFLVFQKNSRPEMPRDFKGERPDFENMTEEEREEMKEKFDGERQKMPKENREITDNENTES